MQTQHALTPWIRIFLRYGIGGVGIGSIAFGDQLVADPDLIFALSMIAAAAVEGGYIAAKKLGWAT